MLIVAQDQFVLAPLDRVLLAGVERGLEFIEASRGGGPVTVVVPGKPAPAPYPPAKPVHGGQPGQANGQAWNGHEKQPGHVRLTHRAGSTFLSPGLPPTPGMTFISCG